MEVKMLRKLQKYPKLFTNILNSLFFSLLIVTVFIKEFSRTTLSSFDKRIISQATIDGVEIGARNSIFFTSVLLLVISYVFFNLLFTLIQKPLITFEKNAVSLFSLFGITTIAYNLLGAQSKINIMFILSIQILLIFVFYVRILTKKLDWPISSLIYSNKHLLIWLFLQSFAIMVYAFYVGKSLFNYQGSIPASWLVYGFMTCFIILLFLTNILMTLLKHKSQLANNEELISLYLFTFPISVSPIFLPLSNELYLIFNQNGLFLPSAKVILYILLSISLITGIVLCKLKSSPVRNIKSLFEKGYYPLFLLVIVSMSYKPVKEIGPPSELFESGNPGIGIDQFFQYGKIPILETFNAHAASELIAPFIYSILNGYQDGASFIYDKPFKYIVFLMISYFLLRKLIGSEFALFTLLFLPFTILTSYIVPEYYIFGVIALFGLHKMMKASSFSSYIFFWLTLSLTFVWRFDVGAAAIPAAILSLLLYLILYKERWNIKKLLGSGTVVGLFWLLLFISLAVVKEIHIGFRLKELMAVVSSNQVWGITSLGETSKINYYLFYFILPAVTVFLLGILLKKRREINPFVFTTVSFLLFFTIFNYPRGLVRHSLVENTSIYLSGFVALPILFLPYIVNRTKPIIDKFSWFILNGFLLSMLIIGTMYGTRVQDTSLFSSTIENYSVFNDYEPSNTKVNRYVISDEYRYQVYQGLKVLLDQTTEPYETFLDFSNSPYLYVHTDREVPMYINQTPSFLSDEITQSAYLKEIESYSVPYVVFADRYGFSAMDGVPNPIRSYRVAEYIYNRYVPFVELYGFNIWVDKNRKEEMEQRLAQKSSVEEIILVDAGTSNIEKLNINSMKSIEINSNSLNFYTGDNDPFIDNIFSLLDVPKIPLADFNNTQLEIEYSSVKGGELDIFYLLGLTYNEKEHSTEEVISGDNRKLTIDIPFEGMLYNLRLDPPTNDTFKIHSIKVLIDQSKYKEHIYPAEEQADIGYVPLLWGEKDTLNAAENSKVLEVSSKHVVDTSQTYPVSSVFNKKEGNYLLLRMQSTQIGEDYDARLHYGSFSNPNAGHFTFKVKSDGKYHDYLIRVSSQYNWYLTDISSISIDLSKRTNVESISILKGD